MTDDNERKIDDLITRSDIGDVERAMLLLLRDLVREQKAHATQEMRLFRLMVWLLSGAIALAGTVGTIAKEDYNSKTAMLYDLKERIIRMEAGN